MRAFRRLMALAIVAAFALCIGASAVQYVFATGDTWLRMGPGLQYDQITVIAAGDAATYLSSASTDSRGVRWYNVRYGTEIGWVSEKFTNLTANITDATVSYQGYVEVTGDANLRSGPGTKFSSLDVLREGTYAVYLGDTAYDDRPVAWYRINYNGASGWISSKFAALTPSTKSGFSFFERYVKALGNTNIRSGPGLNYEVLTVMRTGETADYMEEDEYDSRPVVWHKVNFDGVIGWVSSKLTEVHYYTD